MIRPPDLAAVEDEETETLFQSRSSKPEMIKKAPKWLIKKKVSFFFHMSMKPCAVNHFVPKNVLQSKILA